MLCSLLLLVIIRCDLKLPAQLLNQCLQQLLSSIPCAVSALHMHYMLLEASHCHSSAQNQNVYLTAMDMPEPSAFHSGHNAYNTV